MMNRNHFMRGKIRKLELKTNRERHSNHTNSLLTVIFDFFNDFWLKTRLKIAKSTTSNDKANIRVAYEYFISA